MLPTQINRFDPKYASFGPKHLKPQQTLSNFKPQALPDIGETPPRVEPAPLATFQRPPSQNQDKYATIRTGGKYDKSHKYAQQMEREEAAAATLDRRQAQNKRQSSQKPPSDKAPNGVSIINQPLPEPPSSQPAPQPLSAAHFTQYRSPAPPLAPCCPQGGQQSQHRSHSSATQNRQGRTPEKFFSTSSQQQGGGRMQQGQQRPSYSHTLDRRHAHSFQQQQQQQMMQQQQQSRGGTQTLDRRSRQRAMPAQHQQQDGEGNKDMYAVTEL